MKLIDFWSYDDSEEIGNWIGITWHQGLQAPFSTIEKPDQDYYSSITFKIYLFKNLLNLTLRLKKQPYRNYREFLIWRKNEY